MSRLLKKKYNEPEIYEYAEKQEDKEWGFYCSSCGDKRQPWEEDLYGDRCALCYWDNVEHVNRQVDNYEILREIMEVAIEIQRVIQADLTRFAA